VCGDKFVNMNENKDLPLVSETIDARGHRCPVPTLKLRRAIEVGASGIVVLLADDPMAQIDVPHFCTQNGHILELCEAHDAYWVFRIRAQALDAI